ncbi:DNA-directed RNA polymerase subunit H [Candidatus Woesearchaeota archaeon]|nr:DNA-directed RNA polymerase subunit H [Candidatus Woesearchaeota archaeon]
MTFDVTKHHLVPKHTKLSESEKSKMLGKYGVEALSLPKIMTDDPALKKLDVKTGDIIKIERKSKTAGASEYYRVVVEG